MFGGAAPGGDGDGHGLFLAWLDAPLPLLATSAGWAGGTPAPTQGLPGGEQAAIGPHDCNLTSHTKRPLPAGGTELMMVLSHAPTSLRFHVNASLGAGSSGALNLSLQVELPAPRLQTASSPRNVTLAFPYIRDIAIGSNGSSNAGINHFGTGLATDGSLPAWRASGGLYGWQTSQTFSSVWEPSSGDGLAMIIKDKSVLGAERNDTQRQRVIMRFPASGPGAESAAPPAGGMYALNFPATEFGQASTLLEPNPPVQLLVHSGGWRVAAKQYGRHLREIGVTSRKPPAWLDDVQSKDSAWMPDAATVAQSKSSGQGLTSFEHLYERFYATNQVDMIEFAMCVAMLLGSDLLGMPSSSPIDVVVCG